MTKNITPKVIFLGTIIFLVSFVSTEKVSELLFSRNQLAQVGSTTQGLVGYWNFNEGSGNTISDSSSNNATLSTSGTFSWISGKQGSAISLNTYPAFSAPSNLGILDYPFTLSVWSRPTGNNDLFKPALALGKTGPQYYGIGWTSTNQPSIAARNTTLESKTAAAVPINNWTHIVGVFTSATNRKLYVNGVLAATDTVSVPSFSNPTDIYVGTINTNAPNMEVDEARVYNRALSVSEILDIYNANYSSTTPPPTPVISPSTTVSAASSSAIIPTGNGITIQDLSGSAQVNRAFTISRVFKQGEIFQYPKARVGGTATLTQADVKSRWPDGSVKHVLISFIVPSLPANSYLFVDFVNQSTPNNAGQLTKTQMLNYNGGAWGGKIQTSIGSADARAMLSGWDGIDRGLNGQGVRYWMKGPIVTQVIVEDKAHALTYDFGSDSNKSLHPIFVLTFYPGTNTGVKIDYILENMWTTKLQDQSYDLTLLAGNPANTTVYPIKAIKHIAKTRWRKTFWSGTTPQGWTDPGHPGVNINYNFPYITSSYVLPNFDMSRTISAYDINKTISSFNDTDKGDIMGQGKWSARKFASLDDHSESSLVPMYYARYLYTFDPELYAVMLGQAGVSAHIPVHMRESAAASGSFDSGNTVDAFGLPLSINARPRAVSRIGEDTSLSPVGPLTEGGWSPDLAHQPSFTYVPYLITGDWYYLEETNFWSSYNLAWTGSEVRHSSWGILVGQGIQTRGEARGLLPVGHSAFMSPDGSYEKNYYTEKLYNNIAVREGQHNITDGAFYEPCMNIGPFNNETLNQDPSISRWCWGRNINSAGRGQSNPLHFPSPTPSDPDYPVDPTKATSALLWHMTYHHIVNSHLLELGFPIRKVRDTVIQNLLGQLQDPTYNPNLIASQLIPLRPKGAGTSFYQNWSEVKDAFTDDYENRTTLEQDNSYDVEVRAAASFLPGINKGGLSGDAAWNWISSRVSTSQFPNWSFLPRVQ